MPFIGNQPALSYTSFAKQDFTTSATTSYTLDQPVANANELALFINFVRQEPTTAYTASGTTLTLTSATSATDDMYCVFLGKAVQTVNPPSGSVGISQLSATGTKDATTFLRGDNTFASAGGDNTPNFRAYVSSSQSISANTLTKINFDTEAWDVGSKFDTSNNRFTPGEAGYFFLYANVFVSAFSDQNSCNLLIVKNGSTDTVYHRYRASGTANASINLSNVVYSSNATDYFEVKINTQDACNILDRTDYSYFGGYKLIGV
jgi:hypothetical protein